MTFVLKTVLAVTAGGIIALTLNANARPVPAAIPILVATLVFAALALLAIEIDRGREDDVPEAPPREVEPPSGGGDGFTRPRHISGTVLNIRSFSGLIGQALPGVGHTVRVKLIEAGGGKTFHLDFGEGWAGALREYHRGDSLTATGWLKKATADSVYFVGCTLPEHGST